jgi:hypothetical protein
MAESVFSDAIPELLSEHFRHLTEGSGISVDCHQGAGIPEPAG